MQEAKETATIPWVAKSRTQVKCLSSSNSSSRIGFLYGPVHSSLLKLSLPPFCALVFFSFSGTIPWLLNSMSVSLLGGWKERQWIFGGDCYFVKLLSWHHDRQVSFCCCSLSLSVTWFLNDSKCSHSRIAYSNSTTCFMLLIGLPEDAKILFASKVYQNHVPPQRHSMYMLADFPLGCWQALVSGVYLACSAEETSGRETFSRVDTGVQWQSQPGTFCQILEDLNHQGII